MYPAIGLDGWPSEAWAAEFLAIYRQKARENHWNEKFR